MTSVKEVMFSDAVAPIVEELVQRMEEKWGANCLSPQNKKKLRFSLRHPRDQKDNRAFKLFVIIEAVRDGAIVRCPKTMKADPRRISLSADTINEALRLGDIWFQRVSGIKAPVGFQGIDDKRVVPAGRFESNPRKF